MNRIPASTVNTAVVTLVLVFCATVSSAQQVSENSRPVQPPGRESDLDRHLDELTSKLDSMRQQLIESQSEMDELRSELRTLREQLSAKDQTRVATQDADALRTGVAQLQDETEILQAQVKQHDQSKVETVSKYPLRINGAVLFTSILNSGNVDNINVPVVALPPNPDSLSGSLSATANQTMLGLDVTGPHVWGAHSWGDLNVDFWGGASSANYTATAGTVRLRTMHARVEWPERSITIAVDRPLMSPWQPASWVTVAEPALAWSGNLWTWSPQVEFRENDFPLRHTSAEVGLIFPSPRMPGFRASPADTERGGTEPSAWISSPSGHSAFVARSSVQSRCQRILQPSGIRLRPACGRLGGRRGLEPRLRPCISVVRGNLSRPRHWRPRRRNLQGLREHRGYRFTERAGCGRRVDTGQVYDFLNTRGQHQHRAGQFICPRTARLRPGIESQLLCNPCAQSNCARQLDLSPQVLPSSLH